LRAILKMPVLGPSCGREGITRSAQRKKPRFAGSIFAHAKPTPYPGVGDFVHLSDEPCGNLRLETFRGGSVIACILFDKQVMPITMPCGYSRCAGPGETIEH